MCGIVFVVFIPLGHLLAWVSTAPTELNLLLSVFTQGSISGFALIPPWALQECRPCRALCTLYLCVPRVSYRALPSFHPGLCRSVALAGLIVVLDVCGIVFVKCVWVCQWIVAFVFLYLFDCDCMGCGGGLFGGIVGAVG